MSLNTLEELTRPIAQCYSAISPATSTSLSSSMPLRTAVCFSLVSITLSLLTFCVNFTLFRRQWRRLFAHPQRFFGGNSGRFLHIVDSVPNPADIVSTFLFLSLEEFTALQSLAHATITQSEPLQTLKTNYASVNTNTNTNFLPIHNKLQIPPRVYPIVGAPIYSEYST